MNYSLFLICFLSRATKFNFLPFALFALAVIVALVLICVVFKRSKFIYSNYSPVKPAWRAMLGSIIPNIVISVFAVFLLFFAIGYRPFVVTSGSMRPSIEPGAIILIKKVDMQDLNVGDTITFSREGNVYTTHRIVAIKKDGTTFTNGEEFTYTRDGVSYVGHSSGEGTIITNGTGNEATTLDPTISYANVRGKVFYCFWYVGLVFEFLFQRQLVALLFAIAIIFFARRGLIYQPQGKF